MRLSLESQTGPRLSGAAPVALELSRAKAVGELVVSWLLMGLLSFPTERDGGSGTMYTCACRWWGFCVLFCFNVTCCNAYHRLNVISDLNNNSVDNLLEFLLLEARWEGWKVAEAAVMHLISSLGAPSCVQQDFCLLKLLLLLLL